MQRVILFPGMGADQRLYRAQQAALPGLEAPGWIEPKASESLRAYAARWGAMLDLKARPAVLGGVSMGGMIALEMARAHGARGVVLLGSCRHPRAVSGVLKACERMSRWTPEIVLDKGRVLGPVFLGRGGGISREDRALLGVMAREVPVGFLRWAGRAILDWDGCEDGALRAEIPVHHMHGDHDWVIPLSRVKATEVVKGGAHVLNMSSGREVNGLLARVAEAKVRSG